MKNYAIENIDPNETASDLWLQQWVEESTNDFASVDLDDFILID